MVKTIKVSDETWQKLDKIRMHLTHEQDTKRIQEHQSTGKMPPRKDVTYEDVILQREKDIEQVSEEINGLTKQLMSFGIRPYWTKKQWMEGCMCGAYSIDSKPVEHSKLCPLYKPVEGRKQE